MGWTYLAVQWLRLLESSAGGAGWLSGQGAKIPHALWHGSTTTTAKNNKKTTQSCSQWDVSTRDLKGRTPASLPLLPLFWWEYGCNGWVLRGPFKPSAGSPMLRMVEQKEKWLASLIPGSCHAHPGLLPPDLIYVRERSKRLSLNHCSFAFSFICSWSES